MKRYLLSVVVFSLLLVSKGWSVVPVVTDWNSTGGITQNKNDAKDIMYLVTENDNLIFTVTVDQTVDYEWQVNKSTETSVNANTFNWTVPNEKGIWEIHLKCWNATNEEVHKEWVVSTLSSGEAPDIFDSFSDGNYENRIAKDPWERSLSIWTIESGTIDVSGKYLLPVSLQNYHATFSVPFNVMKGTWIFRYKYINGIPSFTGNNYLLGLVAKYLNASNGDSLLLNNPMDGHWWLDFLDGRRIPHGGYIVNMVGSQINKDLVAGNNWHEVVFIKDENGYMYAWLDKKLVRWSKDRLEDDEIPDSTKFVLDLYDMLVPQMEYPIAFDNVQIYANRYIPPVNNVIYNSSQGNIVIQGFGITLDEIDSAINDSAIFYYNSLENTAIAYKDILVDRGSELKIENGKLLMASSYDGERKIKYYTDSKFYVSNATISSKDNYYFLWSRLSDGDANFKEIFEVINSTISNCGGIFFERPVTVCIENSNFTDLVGTYPIQVYFRWSQRELKIKNVRFTGKTGTEKIRFTGGDQFNELFPKPVGMEIIDSDLSNVIIEFANDSPYYLSPGTPGCTANIINTKTGTISYLDTIIRVKYYLDVKVIDSNGNVVSGASVNVVNEKDEINYPSENILRGKKYFQLQSQFLTILEPYFTGQTTNWIKGWADVNDHSNSDTNVNGHTALPIDENNTFVITDYVKNVSGNTEYTYTIKASKDGATGEINGIDPDETWYRPDPNVPAKTVVIVLGGQSYVTDDAVEPALSIITPQNGTNVFSKMPVKVNASDNYGVVKVEFYVDDVLMSVDTEGPYEWIWDAKDASEGEHSLKVVAYDTNGNSAQQVVIIKVIKVEGIVTYPNPYIKGKSLNEIINFSNLPKEAAIRIYTISGELVKTIKHKDIADGGSEEWDISGVAGGIYIYTIISSEGKKTGKVSIVK